jgi:hypothetical protein
VDGVASPMLPEEEDTLTQVQPPRLGSPAVNGEDGAQVSETESAGAAVADAVKLKTGEEEAALATTSAMEPVLASMREAISTDGVAQSANEQVADVVASGDTTVEVPAVAPKES